MKDFSTAQIRNVALVAHHGVGKTSLAEAMLFLAKATNRLGRIADGTTLLDYAADEIHRQLTINLALAQFEWSGHKVNLLDTPGYADFVGDVHCALRVADSAILVLRANTGAEVGTEVVWEILRHEKTPTLLVVNMMDKEHADFAVSLKSLRDRIGLNAVPAQLPIGQAETFPVFLARELEPRRLATGPVEQHDRVARGPGAVPAVDAAGTEEPVADGVALEPLDDLLDLERLRVSGLEQALDEAPDA